MRPKALYEGRRLGPVPILAAALFVSVIGILPTPATAQCVECVFQRCCEDPFCDYGEKCGTTPGGYDECQTVGSCEGCIGWSCFMGSSKTDPFWKVVEVEITTVKAPMAVKQSAVIPAAGIPEEKASDAPSR